MSVNTVNFKDCETCEHFGKEYKGYESCRRCVKTDDYRKVKVKREDGTIFEMNANFGTTTFRTCPLVFEEVVK
jgi:hypothetical protein